MYTSPLNVVLGRDKRLYDNFIIYNLSSHMNLGPKPSDLIVPHRP